jgi:hypothetical protein
MFSVRTIQRFLSLSCWIFDVLMLTFDALVRTTAEGKHGPQYICCMINISLVLRLSHDSVKINVLYFFFENRNTSGKR